MKTTRSIFLTMLFFWITGFSTSAFATIDPSASVVLVRTSCTVNGTQLNDCFENLWSLTSWLSTTRHPNADSPLKVEIGAGTFGPDVANEQLGNFIACDAASNYTGHISFEGAGITQTIITGVGGNTTAPLNVNSCTELSFSHLKITSTFYGAVRWNGGGVSHWNDVQLIGIGRTWYEPHCGASPGTHYWTSSLLTGTLAGVALTYEASCDESFFFGSQISVAIPSTYSGSLLPGGAVVAHNAGIIHLYGSHLAAYIDGGDSQSSNAITAANASSGGMIHMHGTGIDVSSQTGKNITALTAASGGMIHANSSAFMLASTGTVTRISNNGGTVMAPYLWQEAASPPNVISANGSDQVVITSTSDGHPHLLIYDNTCSSTWYDANLNACH